MFFTEHIRWNFSWLYIRLCSMPSTATSSRQNTPSNQENRSCVSAALVFDRGFTILKLEYLYIWEVTMYRLCGILFCYLIGHMHALEHVYLKHYNQHKTLVAGPYSQYTFLQASNTIFVLEFHTHSLEQLWLALFTIPVVDKNSRYWRNTSNIFLT